jgi:hypothetical protein
MTPYLLRAHLPLIEDHSHSAHRPNGRKGLLIAFPK